MTLFHSQSLCDVGPTKGLNHSGTAHDVCSFRRPSGCHKSSKMGIERGEGCRAIGILLYVAEPLNISKPKDTHSCCGAYKNTTNNFHFASYFSDGEDDTTHLSFVEKEEFFFLHSACCVIPLSFVRQAIET